MSTHVKLVFLVHQAHSRMNTEWFPFLTLKLKEYLVILTTSFYDIQEKAYFQNFSWFQFYVFKLCMIICVLLFPYTTVLIKSCVQDFLWKLLSFHTEMIPAFGEVCFLEQSHKNVQKFFDILRRSSIWHQKVCF